MPHSREYTRSRWIAMQITMWVLLAGTVGLAALVSGYRKGALELKLDAPQKYRSLTVRLPRGWQVTPESDELSPSLLTAIDTNEEGAREMQIFRSMLSTRSTPLEVLDQGRVQGDGPLLRRDPITIAGQQGVLAAYLYQPNLLGRGMSFDAVPMGHVVAATVLPSGRSLKIDMVVPGQPDDFAVSVVRRIAESISASDEPVITGSKIELPWGMTAQAPDGFHVINSTGPNRTECRLRATDASQGWRSITVVPILYLPGDTIESLRTIVSLADQDLVDATIKPDGEGTYRADPSPSSGRAVSPSRAVLRIDKSGRGILALLSGGSNADWIDASWQALSQSLSLSEDFDAKRLVDAGNTEIARLKSEVIPKLMTQTETDSWWTYCMTSTDHPFGWMHVMPMAGGWGARMETRVRFQDRVVQQIDFSWQGSMDATSCKTTSTCQMAPDRGDASTLQFQRYLLMTSQLKQGKLDLHVKPARGDTIDRRLNVPDNFIPGGMLCDLIGKLSDSRMIVQTDAVLWYEDAHTSSPITLLIEPDPTPADDLTFRRVRVEMNGTGQRQVWLIDRNGSVASVSYDDGLVRVRREAAEVEVDFARNPVMKP